MVGPRPPQSQDADDLGGQVLGLLVPEGVGQGRALDVLDHVGDVAAERGRVEVGAADDVPADAAGQADLVVVGQAARERALLANEISVVALGVDDEPAHLPGRVACVLVDELCRERILRSRRLGGAGGARYQDAGVSPSGKTSQLAARTACRPAREFRR
jgi:hypothetical protein